MILFKNLFIFITLFFVSLFTSCTDKNNSISHPQYDGNFIFNSLNIEQIVTGYSYQKPPE